MKKEEEKMVDKYSTSKIEPSQTGELPSYTKDETDTKFSEANEKIKEINYTLIAVVIVLLVMVGTLLIDSFHINSTIYKEYSQKTESIEITQEINETLLKQVQDLSGQIKQGQEIIKQLLNK